MIMSLLFYVFIASNGQNGTTIKQEVEMKRLLHKRVAKLDNTIEAYTACSCNCSNCNCSHNEMLSSCEDTAVDTHADFQNQVINNPFTK